MFVIFSFVQRVTAKQLWSIRVADINDLKTGMVKTIGEAVNS
jgi:hypothetical protein